MCLGSLVVEGYCPSAMSACTCKRPRATTTQVDACMATVDHDRQGQAADSTNHAQWLRPLQVKTMHKTFLSTRGSAHDFSVKLISTCV